MKSLIIGDVCSGFPVAWLTVRVLYGRVSGTSRQCAGTDTYMGDICLDDSGSDCRCHRNGIEGHSSLMLVTALRLIGGNVQEAHLRRNGCMF